MIDAIQASNGTMTLQDLSDYKIVSRPAVSINYRDFKLFSTSAPSSGAIALSTFKTIEGYTMNNSSLLNLSTHRLDEAIRFAYAAHAEIGDPKFVHDLDVESFETEILKASTAEGIRDRISDDRTRNVSYYNPKGIVAPDSHGTSHIVTADSDGMSVSLTTTINLLFGSGILEPITGELFHFPCVWERSNGYYQYLRRGSDSSRFFSTKTWNLGIILNDEMCDFSIPNLGNPFGFAPSPHNFVQAHKRPLSSITPIIIEHASNSSLYASIGAAGGSRIITATIQSLWHVLDHAMGIADALKMPRLHDQLIPNVVGFEVGYDEDVVRDMEGKGHKWGWIGQGSSSVQGLRVLGGVPGDGGLIFEAAGEPRQLNSAGLVF